MLNIKKDEQRQSIQDLADHFFYLDNKLIEAYCGQFSEQDFTQEERPEVLEDEAFLHYIRQLTQEV